MKKKYNDNSTNYADWTTKKLKQEYRELYNLIYKVECYGRSDLMYMNYIGRELLSRNIEINSIPHFN